jgi:glycosyltransferase involved in cell wall biosynthesis/SAM-dependent methyltransferase
MRIVFLCLGMPFNGETVKTKSLGGSESAAYYQCKELAARGHEVTMFTNCTEEGEFDGVKYFHAGTINEQQPLGQRFEYYARNTDHDVLIIQRIPHAFHNQFSSRINILQMHDLALYRQGALVNHGMWNVDVVTAVSEFHKEQMIKVYGFDPRFVKIVRNGVDADLYKQQNNLDVSLSEGFNLIYSSRPERGLENLVREGGIMDQLRDTNAHLYVCAYANTVPQMAQYYAKLEEDIKKLPNVTQLGSLNKSELAQLQMRCDLMVYPTEFEEVSCISVMEAMHAGLPVLTNPVGALPETLLGAGAHLMDMKDIDGRGFTDIDAWVSEIKILMTSSGRLLKMQEQQRQLAIHRTWVGAVDKLEHVIDGALKARKGSPTALARHAIEHSDIELASEALKQSKEINLIEAKTTREIGELYAFTTSQENYSAHYAKHQSAYYDSFEDRVIGEDITGSNRYRGVGMFFYKFSQANPGRKLRVLDYGCAHGHYLVPLSKDFGNCDFVGVDVSARAIGACGKWLQKEGISAELIIGNEDIFDDMNMLCPYVKNEEGTRRKLFDIIYAGEVLEHVPDYSKLLENFRKVLAPGGCIIITTPTGRWEWTGTASFRTAREHLCHFDRADIREICAENDYEIAAAPAGADKTGKPLGSFVWCVWPTKAFGKVDYTKKLENLSPRQTISACLIVKNGEKTIRKCIDSLIDWVDEIVIAVDPDTTDRTGEVLNNLKADNPYKAIAFFEGVSAMKDGFDAARNFCIQHANGDWILWIDADEELQQGWNLWKYLKNSQVQGFGFPQVHYSCNPPTVLTTDYPCRVFRNNVGLKFFGVVHEHPESSPGKSIPFAQIRTDVQFLHTGYVDEETRRARFVRNLPLLYRDLEKNPNRTLNKFLFLRDIAQELMFESEQTGGAVLQGHAERAMHGVRIWEEILSSGENIRMVVDSVKYYSHCCAVLGKGFEASFTYQAKPDGAQTMAANLQVEGRFYSREHFKKLLDKLHEESTKHYESKYF